MSELILYRTEDGQAEVSLHPLDGSVWLSQLQPAELFATSVPNANIHIRNLLKEVELSAEAVIKESLIATADGKVYRTNQTARAWIEANEAHAGQEGTA